jgi:hypothetical protein
MKDRHEAHWVFPSNARDGHLEQGTAKTQHSAAIAKVNAETVKANAKRQAAGEKPLPLPLVAFEPYVMRHTALTRMAPFCDAFTLARIAGHSSITITQRYCHPQADAVEAAFSKFGNRSEVVTDGGHRENRQLAESNKAEAKTGALMSGLNGERGRNRTFNLLIKSQLLCQLSYAPGLDVRAYSRRSVGAGFAGSGIHRFPSAGKGA